MAKKILLVDDAMTIRKLERAMLGSSYEYLEAGNGAEANTLARQCLPDLIVMDLHMPVQDGIDGLAALKREPATQRIPVLILTSENEEQKRLRCLALGCAGFLRKPIDRLLFKTTVSRLLFGR